MIIGSLVFNHDEQVAQFVSDHIPQMLGARFNDPFHAVGVIRENALVGGVVFYNKRYAPSGQLVDIEMSGAFTTPDWCRPSTLRALFKFPFVVLDAARMTTITSKKNKRARMIDEGLGFKYEGCHPQAIDGVQDAVSYGLLRKNCLWLDPARQREAVQHLRVVREKWKKIDGRKIERT